MERSLEKQKEYEILIDKLARGIVQRRLGVLAIVLLESVKPLSFLGSQIMVFLDPFVSAFFNPKNYRLFYEMIEDRDNLEKLIQKIEEYESRLEEK